MRFSERHGFRPVREALQVESIDAALRGGLWSVLSIRAWQRLCGDDHGAGAEMQYNDELQNFCAKLWMHYFKRPVDSMPRTWPEVRSVLREHFFIGEWYEPYDLIEFVVQNGSYRFDSTNIVENCNYMLERELSAYRIVENRIVPITDAQEIESLESAFAGSADSVRSHLVRALELMSDRNNPDYRNSIKESISAVESLVALQTGKRSGSLGDLLKLMEKNHNLHPALKAAFSSLYGFTSDSDGIRHKMLESPTVDFHGAKFMLITCSAFVNFTIGKQSKY